MHPGTSLAEHIEYVTENGRQVALLSRERQALHDKIAEDLLTGITPQPGRKPVYTFLGGGAASGKSTLTESGQLADWPNLQKGSATAVLIDSDAIKRLLPEYDSQPAATAAAYTHNESYMIAQRVSDMAMERGLDVVMDGTGVTDMEKKISRAQLAGYKVRGVYVTVALAEARRRNNMRGKTSKRLVPVPILDRTHSAASQIVPRLAPKFDEFELWDTNTAAKQIAHLENGTLVVDDATAYSEFLKKAR